MAIKLKPLRDQTIVITGGSSGIGLATARRAAKAGAKVVIVARNEAALREAAEQIEREGGTCAYLAVDIADADAAERIGALADERFGGFDTWVNDAASALYARLEQTDMAEHRRVFDVGYFGTVAASLYAVKRLKTQGGALINLGSILSDVAIPVQGSYCAMKHAVKSFTQTLRMESEIDGGKVAITLIKPAGIDTPYPEHARNKMGQPGRIPPLLYDPELVARAICFCAEHQRSEVTVGGAGVLITTVGTLFPRLSERVMELGFHEPAQTTDMPPEPGAVDNLFAARDDGREHSNQPHFVRRSSLALEAQLHPFATMAITASAIAAGVAAFALKRRR